MTTPDITFITVCKGRLRHLKESLPRLLTQSGVDWVIVDYDCPDHAGDWVEANHPQARVVRVTNSPRFNLSDARNRGAAAAKTEWLAFIDADTLVEPGLAEALRAKMGPNRFLRPEPVTAYGFLAVSRAAFVGVGGYDDVIQGWGGEDDEFKRRLSHFGQRPTTFDGRLLSDIPHGDDDRTANYDIRDREISQAINLLYLSAKSDLMLMGAKIDTATRRSLYASCRGRVLNGPQTEPPADLEIGCKQTRVGPWRMETFLRYRLRRSDES